MRDPLPLPPPKKQRPGGLLLATIVIFGVFWLIGALEVGFIGAFLMIMLAVVILSDFMERG